MPSSNDRAPAKGDNRKVWIGGALTFVGICGMFFFVRRIPSDVRSIFATAEWAFGTTLSTIVALSGMPGILYGRLRSHHLKMIDLVWVLASAVAVVFAVVQVAQLSVESDRATLAKNVEKSRRLATEYANAAFQEQCAGASTLTVQQCEALHRLTISLRLNEKPSLALVGSLCSFPIDLSKPPHGFGRPLVEACINANYVANATEEPLLNDQNNEQAWHLATHLWPLLMIFLVALRVMKSVAEVFWGIK